MKISNILIFALVVSFAISAFSISAYAATDNQCYFYDLNGEKVILHEYDSQKTWDYVSQMEGITFLDSFFGSYVLYNGKPITLNGVLVKKTEVVRANTPYTVVDRDLIHFTVKSGDTLFNCYAFEGDSWNDYKDLLSVGTVQIFNPFVTMIASLVCEDEFGDNPVSFSDVIESGGFYYLKGSVKKINFFYDNNSSYFYSISNTWEDFINYCNDTGLYDVFTITEEKVMYVNGCREYYLYYLDGRTVSKYDACLYNHSGNNNYYVKSNSFLSVHSDTIISTITREATCASDGVVHYYCNECDDEWDGILPRESVSCTWVQDNVNQPNCFEEGSVEYVCSVCGDTKTEVIPCVDCSWVVINTKEATCVHDGEVTYTCEFCGDERTEIIKATGHVYDGFWDYNCNVCGYNTLTGSSGSDSSGSDSIVDGITDGINGVVDGFNDGLNKLFSIVFGIVFFFLVLKAIPLVIDIFRKIFIKKKRR